MGANGCSRLFTRMRSPALRSGCTGCVVGSTTHVAFFEGMCVSCPNGENGALMIFWLTPLLPILATSYTRMPLEPSATYRYSPRSCRHCETPPPLFDAFSRRLPRFSCSSYHFG